MKKALTSLIKKLGATGELIVHCVVLVVSFLCIYLVSEVGGTPVIVASLILMFYLAYVLVLVECIRAELGVDKECDEENKR